MEAQEIFDKVATHLLNQNERSVMANNEWGLEKCMYRGSNSLMCAVGCLIPDELYERNMEKLNVWVLMQNYKRVANLFGDNCELLRSLQICHDIEQPHRWPEDLARIAKKYALQIPAILKEALKES